MRNCKFEVVRSKNRKGWFWRFKAANGKTLCHSEVYTTVDAAENSITVVKLFASKAAIKKG